MQEVLHLRGGMMQKYRGQIPVSTPISTARMIPAWQWLTLVACASAMFAPTLYRLLSVGAWTTPEYSHGPLVLAVSFWLLWLRLREPVRRSWEDRGGAVAWAILIPAAFIYLLGRVLLLDALETLSFIGVSAALAVLTGGTALLRQLRFPIAFMLFMVPLPTAVVGLISGHIKPWVASAAVNFLSLFHLPVGRGGATIVIGQYQLLVADACAGMNNLLMLEAFGVLYLYLVRRGSVVRDIALAIMIVPISFLANVSRVIALVLVTFYVGEAAGEGFIHKFAGVLTFVVALLVVLAVDNLLCTLLPTKKTEPCPA
jgi:exosortase